MASDPVSAAPSSSTNQSICPVSMNYVSTVSWNHSTCLNFQPLPSKQETRTTTCCKTLLNLFGIALADNLKKNSLFHLPNISTSISCLEDYQSKLTSLLLPNNLVSSCFDPLQFVISPNICANIQTKQDWINRVGPSNTALVDTACEPDLTDFARCQDCVNEGYNVQQMVARIDGNDSHSQDCFYFTILYIAGIVNKFGPESKGVLSCILLVDSLAVHSDSRKGHHALVGGLVGASIAFLFIIASLLGLLFWYKRWVKRKSIEKLLASFESQEETRSSQRLRPNAGLIWFKFEDLVKATNNFSPQNFIGRGGSGSVYKGILPDGKMVAVKRIEESDYQGDAEFYREVGIVSSLKHRNLVPLRGCCVVVEHESAEYTGRYLVLDYMPNGTLKDHLFPTMDNENEKKSLTWPQRRSIILDVANGLVYLHFGVKPAIYHRDIKATNILLDAGMRARVADFGLAKQNSENESSTRNIMERFLLVGILSSHVIAASRPTILDVLRMLEGDIEVPPIPDRPMSLGHYMFPSDDSFGMNTEFGFEGLSRFENPSLKNWTRTN
ncbi:Serine/threonine-protein kinase, active site [Sesbania bispinosa]|nr:Serine/threonine-protein kinase, active site [Sesbania bispinosa]